MKHLQNEVILHKKNKIVNEDFDSFSEMIKFVKKYIPEEKINVNKYNL